MERLRVFVGERVDHISTPKAEMTSTASLSSRLQSPPAEDESGTLILFYKTISLLQISILRLAWF